MISNEGSLKSNQQFVKPSPLCVRVIDRNYMRVLPHLLTIVTSAEHSTIISSPMTPPTSGSAAATAKLVVASSKDDVMTHLNAAVVSLACEALADHGHFTIALSGGSLPSFLTALPDAFAQAGVVDPQWSKWHVLLADERCVPVHDEESNLGSIQKHFVRHTSIPPEEVYGINQELVREMMTASSSTASPAAAVAVASQIATEYETTVRAVLDNHSNGRLDLAVLGFGPDGHTCSLFPGHALLQEDVLWVAPIHDSPKPPPDRVTLTYPVLNGVTRHVIVCGAGPSKHQVVSAVFSNLEKVKDDDGNDEDEDATTATTVYTATMTYPPPYPSAAVKPLETLTWLIDADAMRG